MDFRAVLDVVDKVAQRCKHIDAQVALGDVARKALAIVPRKRKSGRGHPPWVKNLAVAMVELFRLRHPEMPLTPPRVSKGGREQPSVLREVILTLAKFRLCPLGGPTTEPLLKPNDTGPTLSVKRLHEWYLERQHKAGRAAPRGRPRKKQ
jgi:hypothetical protein